MFLEFGERELLAEWIIKYKGSEKLYDRIPKSSGRSREDKKKCKDFDTKM